jgi:transcriptional regulator with XRE-family HTH domain/catechol 2,3-dioxygenase-like lactoylglutathione lyase family enzyme
MPKKTTTDALKILAHMTGKDPERQRIFEEEIANREVAHKIFELREAAGLTQRELARRVRTTQSVISRLEDADYEGHSLAMLNRIAAAVEQSLEIHFVPRREMAAGSLNEPEGNWQVSPLSTKPSLPHLKSTMPGFAVRDMDRAVAFYTTNLGFRVSFRNDGVYTIVRRDEVEIGLGLDRSGEKAGRGSCYLKLTGVDAVHAEFLSNGVGMTHDLKDENYGMREFMITDPDGNTVNFGEPIP